MIEKLKNTYHLFLAWLGAILYRNPSRELIVIGITGTKGKTTSVELLRAVLQNAGKKTAMLSSANIAFGDDIKSRGGNTMPGRFFIQKFMRQAIERGCQYAVFEVTSQGVVQHRHRFIDFNIAAITCLHPEHIESHGGYEQYREAKVSFFRDTARLSRKDQKMFFINSEMTGGGDAEYFEQAVLHPTGKGNFGAVKYYNKEDFARNELRGDKKMVSDWLQSDFNLENAALVFSIARGLNIPREVILETFKYFQGVSGRLEFIRGTGKTAVIDYALTPGSLVAVYKHLKGLLQPEGKLIAVFGSAGGGRDIWKRPELGKIADQFCDVIYLTADDSYDEKTEHIIYDIKKGIADASKVSIITDRAEAISQALRIAGSRDIVAITGMGSQSYTYGPGGKKSPWSDREEVLKTLRELS